MKYILVVDHLIASIPSAVLKLQAEFSQDELGILLLTRHPEEYEQVDNKGLQRITEKCAFEDGAQTESLLEKYKDQIIAVICRGDKQVQFLRHLVPYLPKEVHVASVDSLKAATNKRMMREAFTRLAPDVTPAFLRVHDSSDETVAAVEKSMPYPVIVKPASLVSSLLIQKCETREGLVQALQGVFGAVEAIYQREDRRDTAEVIVEQYLQGDFYSVDAYVRGGEEMDFCPPVAYIPAQQIGIDDFFLYKRFVPTKLVEEEVQACFRACSKALLAIGLTYSAAHIELILTTAGWKIIEIGPRLGRFRNAMYGLGYGIDHSYNDIAIHLNKTPIISRQLKNYCAAYSIYPQNEGTLERIEGIDYLYDNKFVHSLKVMAGPGDHVLFAKNGGKALAEFIIFSPDKTTFDEMVFHIEKNIKARIRY